MVTPEVIGSPQSIYVRAVRLALHEKGVDYRLTPSSPHSPAVTAIHPFGRIPVFRHGLRVLFESRAIMSYVDEEFSGPPLMPGDAYRKAQAEQWLSLLSTTILPIFTDFTKRSYFPDLAAAAVSDEQLFEDVRQCLELIDSVLADRECFVPDQFTLADLMILPILEYLSAIAASAAMIDDLPHVAGYFARHSSRPSWRATVPPPMAELVAAGAA